MTYKQKWALKGTVHPKIQNIMLFILPVVLFINLVLEISTVEISAFSLIYWVLTGAGNPCYFQGLKSAKIFNKVLETALNCLKL